MSFVLQANKKANRDSPFSCPSETVLFELLAILASESEDRTVLVPWIHRLICQQIKRQTGQSSFPLPPIAHDLLAHPYKTRLPLFGHLLEPVFKNFRFLQIMIC
jgi:hypothetical protein